ncbi:MAG: hypothetical protein ACJAUP_002703 [Cellvibrionaceae bacterium]
MWKLEFDNASNQVALYAAHLASIKERYGDTITQASNIIVEGVRCGHPELRKKLVALLTTLGFIASKVSCFAISSFWEQVQLNLRKRGRPEDQDENFIKVRSADYRQRLSNQKNLRQFTTIDEHYKAAIDFIKNDS